jgi:ligand-binding SRPBCC domain-containing protein
MVADPLADVSAFFETPRNLQDHTPLFLRFQIQTEGDIERKRGALIDYTISLHGVPLKWRSAIESFEKGAECVDVHS